MKGFIELRDGKSVPVASLRTGNARLLRLAAFLRTLPRERFDYNHWVGSDWAGAQDLSCGTQACALGWAATIPALRRAGLTLMRGVWSDIPFVGLKGYHTDDTANMYMDSIESARVVFAIDDYQARFIFTPSDTEDNATPKQVAKKIEKFVANRKSR